MRSANLSSSAHGGPGINPTWSSSAKDFVTSSLGPSRVWATIGRGILNEVYWPTTGRPQIRDLGFIVANSSNWYELKRLNQYVIETPTPFAPVPVIRHSGPGFELTIEVLCDNLRDCVLIRYRLVGDGFRLYPLLAPRMGTQGRLNTAWVDEHLFAKYYGHALCLAASSGYSQASAGFVGESDGWQDFAQHGRMEWSYDRATEGNVALMGELAENEGVLALAFSNTAMGARTLALSALADGFNVVRERILSSWREWQSEIPCRELEDAFRQQADLSAVVLKMMEDRTYPGAVVASLSVPWGNSHDDLGGYHLVWPRDCVETGFAMLAIGQNDEARRMLAYLSATQMPQGCWAQNFFPEGEPYWKGIQVDEAAFPILLAGKLSELGELNGLRGISAMVQQAVTFLVRQGPVTEQDRWEENEGISPFTLAVQIAALAASMEFLADDEEKAFAASFADYLNERVEDWTYVEGSELSQRHDVKGHYMRLGPKSIFEGRLEPIRISNTGGRRYPPEEIVSLEFLCLARLGLRSALDPKMQATWKVVDAELGVDTPSGRSYYRYTHDGYGEHNDGSPFNGTGIGRLWPLLTGEAGHFALLQGKDAAPYLDAMMHMTGKYGLLPEQVWDLNAPNYEEAAPGKPTGSAMPLLWTHSEFLKLIVAREQGRPVELLRSVEARYHGVKPQTQVWHWRLNAPFLAVPHGRNVRIELPFSFRLHYGFDGWQNIADQESLPIGFGLFGVLLSADMLAAHSRFDFSYWSNADSAWCGRDFQFELKT